MKGIRLALRTLLKTPFVTAVAILSLALGIGANAAIFSLFDQMLLQALPVQEPERLVNLRVPGPNPGSQSCGSAGGCDEVLSYPMLRDLEAFESATVSGLAGHVSFGVNLSLEGRTTNGTGLQVTGSYFPVLGVQPGLGRLLSPADDENVGGHYVAVLGWDYWQGELGGDPAVLNRTLIINGEPMTVVGVAPRGFQGTTLGTIPDVYVPMTMRGAMNPWFDGWENRRWYWAYAFARLAPGASLEQAQSELTGVYNGIINDVEAALQTGMSDTRMEQFRAKEILLTPGQRGQSSLQGEVQTPLRLLFVITGMVLLIACANIANLLLARGAARGQEMAIRGAMGASRGQLLRQLVTESVLLALMGGMASLFVADWTLGLLPSILPPQAVDAVSVQLRPGVVAFVGLVSLATGFVFGMYPALHATRPDLVTMLKATSGQPSGARAAARFRSSLVTAQIALSMALLVGAGLFIKSLVNVSRLDLGLNTENVITFSISPALNGYESERSMELVVEAEERLRAIPGVTAVTGSLVPALSGDSWGNDASVEGFEWAPDVDANSRYNEVGPGYFGAMQIPLLAGREFVDADGAGAPRVAIINEAFARKFGLDPRTAVGKFMARGSGRDELDIEIVGVVQDAKYNDVKGAVPPVFTLPYRQNDGLTSLNFYVRTGIDPASVLQAIPGVVKALDPNLPVEDLKTLDQQVRENIVMDRLISTLSAAFALLATLLAAVGLYGVLTYTVAQRTREIGLRMALGAPRGKVQGMVLGQVTRMTLVGGVLGVGAALLMGRWAQSLLFGLEPTDPAVVAMVAAMLGGVAFLAGYLPARRASRVDPMVALRHE
ncbi:MAG: ABC transporter permease [Longimicrobiales bacterium]